MILTRESINDLKNDRFRIVIIKEFLPSRIRRYEIVTRAREKLIKQAGRRYVCNFPSDCLR